MEITMSNKKTYDKEFRKDAVKYYLDSGQTYREASNMLGMNEQTLNRWVAKHKQDPSNNVDSKVGEELKKLRKENANLKMEREILKKAVAIFTDKK